MDPSVSLHELIFRAPDLFMSFIRSFIHFFQQMVIVCHWWAALYFSTLGVQQQKTEKDRQMFIVSYDNCSKDPIYSNTLKKEDKECQKLIVNN